MPKKKTALTIEERLQQALVPAEEQPYEVPENWVWVRLESVASWGSGGTPSRKHEEYYNGDILWIKTGELNNGWIYDTEEKITDEGLKKSSAKLFPPYSVLIAMYGATIGKVAILGVPATTNQACACAVCNQSLLYMYLFYYCISQKNVFIEKGKGGAQPNISQIILKQHPIPLPPLSEQQRIVERIEELFAKLDEAMERLQEVADSFAVRKAAILHKAFTGELTKQWRRENGVSDESWEEKLLGDVCSKITDGTHNSPTNSLTGEYMYVTAKNIKDTGIDLSNITYVTKEIHKEIYSRCDVVYGDVLYIKDGATAGIATINTLKEEFSMLSSVALIRADLKLATNEFIKTYLNYRKKEILKNISGSAITRLTLSKIKNIAISLPSLPEQHEIVRLIDDLLARERAGAFKAGAGGRLKLNKNQDLGRGKS